MSSRRPLSPHLSIYRPQITSVLSITHRATGIGLMAGAALLVVWLCAAAYDTESFARVHECLASPAGRFFLIGWTLAFYFHLANGIRHLFWDIGMGFGLAQVSRSGWAVLAFTLLMTALTWRALL